MLVVTGRRRAFGLDLFRALAVSSVVYEHSADALKSTGHGFPLPSWVDGVELFFILSGFLIGALLIEIAECGPSLRSWLVFMMRRWMRTLPAYFVVLVLLMAALPPEHNVGLYAIMYGTLTQNLAWPIPADNWFGVSWSLTIEEWFYLLFSAVFLLAARAMGRRGQWLAIAIFLLLPLLARLEVPTELEWDLYVRKITLLRLDAIAYGVVLARLYADRSALFAAWKPALAAGMVVLVGIWAVFAGLVQLDGIALRSGIFCISAIGWALCFPAALRLAQPKRALRPFHRRSQRAVLCDLPNPPYAP